MRRRSGFLIGFAAAAITFGTLTATLGFKRFNRCGHYYGCGYYQQYHGGENCTNQQEMQHPQ
jgi:hypothetical protein